MTNENEREDVGGTNEVLWRLFSPWLSGSQPIALYLVVVL